MAKRARYVPQSPSLVQPLLQESNMDQSENWLREIKDEAGNELKWSMNEALHSDHCLATCVCVCVSFTITYLGFQILR